MLQSLEYCFRWSPTFPSPQAHGIEDQAAEEHAEIPIHTVHSTANLDDILRQFELDLRYLRYEAEIPSNADYILAEYVNSNIVIVLLPVTVLLTSIIY